MKVIAFGHGNGVGKSTAVKFASTYLRVDKRIENVQQHNFADKVKEQCFELYFWADLKPGAYYEESGNHKKKDIILPKIGKSPRQIWIEYGTTVGRAIYPHTWVDYLFHKHTADVLFIGDLRFPDEGDRILEKGGFVYRVDNPNVPWVDDAATTPLKDWTNWSGVIKNDGSLHDFYVKIITLMEEIC